MNEKNLTNAWFIGRQNDFESSARSYPRKFPFALKSAKGSWVEDVEGNRYLDFLCGAGTLALGHNDDEISKAMIDLISSGSPLHTLDLTTPVKDRYVETRSLFPTKATGRPVGVGTFETNFRNYLKRSGIKKELSPHALRNNFAKRCLMAGMDIYTLSRILGHSSVTITEKAYLDLTDSDIRRRYQAFSPMEHIR